jgi:hypothetical protein
MHGTGGKPTLSSIAKALLPWALAFAMPYLIAYALLFEHERQLAMCEIGRNHTMLDQPTQQPGDEAAAMESAHDVSSVFAFPVGLLGLTGFGLFAAILKLSARRTRQQ